MPQCSPAFLSKAFQIGTLNEDQFYFSQLEPCDNCELNPLPKTIELSGYNPNWNKNFSMILKRVTGDRAFIRPKVWKKHGKNKNVTRHRDNLVITWQSFIL